MPRSDKRVRKCRFGHSELLVPTESATKEHSVDISFKPAHNAHKTLGSRGDIEWSFVCFIA